MLGYVKKKELSAAARAPQKRDRAAHLPRRAALPRAAALYYIGAEKLDKRLTKKERKLYCYVVKYFYLLFISYFTYRKNLKKGERYTCRRTTVSTP